MYRTWIIISLIAFMGIIGSLYAVPNGPIGSTPVGFDGGDNGDGNDDGDDPKPGP